jgi:hypothetical protein
LHTHLPKNYHPLDQEVNDLSLGAKIIIDALLTGSVARKVTLVHTIRD